MLPCICSLMDDIVPQAKQNIVCVLYFFQLFILNK